VSNTYSFVVPVRNDARRLERCLHSIRAAASGSPDWQIIVADNGSTDDSREVARQAGATVMVLPGLKVSQMRNEAATAATGAVLALVDADHVLGSDWCAAALQALEATDAAAVGAPYESPPEGTWVQRAYDRLRGRLSPGRHEVDWLGSGNLAIRATVFRELGGFDPTLESCEDVDLCNRLRARGYRLICEPRMRSVHYGDPASLRALFLSELWRGRDNIKVTFRGPLTLRALPSVLIPIANVVVAMAAPMIGLMTGRWEWLLAPLATLGGATLLRAMRMRRAGDVGDHEGGAGARGLLMLAQNAVVAAVYEAGRAAALILRASHGTRRAG
jgi:glycosyltransferase involved in cell wall biosynthesis